MERKFVITGYIGRAMASAVYEELEDGSWCGRIPPCWGVIALAETAKKCELELRSVLEDWIVTGLRWGDALPVIDGIDLNIEMASEPVESV